MWKPKVATEEQMEAMKRHGLIPALYVVQCYLPNSLIVRNWVTGEFKVIKK